MDTTLSKGRTIKKSYGGRGEFSSSMNFFSLMCPLNEYFFFVKMLCTPGLLCMHEFFT